LTKETDMKVHEIMSRWPALIDPSTTVAEAARAMRNSDLGCLLIGKDERDFGILTDRDIVVRALANGTNPAQERVCDVMSSEADCVGAGRRGGADGVREPHPVVGVGVVRTVKRLLYAAAPCCNTGTTRCDRS
jgi:CBS domain-containing protein